MTSTCTVYLRSSVIRLTELTARGGVKSPITTGVTHRVRAVRVDELVEDLHKADAEGGQWLAVARKLSEKVHHHLREEEKKFFQVTGKILDDKQKVMAAKKYRKDYARMLKKLRA